ncbi:MAG: PIN domain nuclease, partial [Anaerolineales bacterium]
MSFEFIVRIVGMVVFAIFGGYWGFGFGTGTNESILTYTLAFGLVGALFGLVATPYFTTRPTRWLRTFLV